MIGARVFWHFRSSRGGCRSWPLGATALFRHRRLFIFVYLLRVTTVVRHHLGDPAGVPIDEQVSALNGRITALGRLRRWRRSCAVIPIAEDSILMSAAGAHQCIGSVTWQSCGCRTYRLGTQEIRPSISDQVLETGAENSRETSSCIIHSRCLLQHVNYKLFGFIYLQRGESKIQRKSRIQRDLRELKESPWDSSIKQPIYVGHLG